MTFPVPSPTPREHPRRPSGRSRQRPTWRRRRAGRLVSGLVLVIATVTFSSVPAGAQQPPPADPAATPSATLRNLYDTLARETQQAFEAGSFDAMQGRFSAAFLANVPLATLNTIPTSYAAQFGRVTGVVFDEQRDDPEFAPGTLFYTVLLEDDRQAVLRMKLDADLQIVAWHLGPAYEPTMSLDDLRARLRALPGRVSVFARRVGQSTAFFSLNPNEIMAIGSTFKLYVLAELLRQSEDEDKSLDTVVRLRGWGESLPSGRLQDWPRDTPMTLQSLATLMISESDNTATDHLIDAVGRQTLENQLGREYGNSLPQRNIPFLKTREVFLLQARGAPWDSLRASYLAGTISEKRDVLAELRDRTIQGMPAVQPIGRTFNQFEWYATTNNLVDIIGMLCGDSLLRKQMTRDIARGILAVNPGIPAGGDGRIAYVGYKGGSEDGVLNLTQYVDTRSGGSFALSMSWNRDEGSTDLNTLVPLFQSLRSLMLDAVDGDAE